MSMFVFVVARNLVAAVVAAAVGGAAYVALAWLNAAQHQTRYTRALHVILYVIIAGAFIASIYWSSTPFDVRMP